MPQILNDVNPVLLTCQLPDTSNSTMQLLHEGIPLDQSLIIELDQQASTTLSIPDFEHAGKRCRVNAFTIGLDGLLIPWARVDDTVRSPALDAAGEGTVIDVLVVPVDYEPVDPTPEDLATYTATAWDFQTCVTVRKKGSKPIP